MSYSPKPAAKTAQIGCINKADRPNPWERILSVGGSANGGWKISQTDAINKIENGEWSFWVSVDGKSVWVIVGTSRFGNKYLRTEADRGEENNLLSLPECP